MALFSSRMRHWFLCLRVDPAGIVNKATSVAMDADFLVTRSLSFFEVSSDFIAF